ncbi:MAG: SPOR domain-containing protein [Ignavibacteriales bacterium]|nr:SPOR domain-containing protein [Ignavibacteriales bacterium]
MRSKFLAILFFLIVLPMFGQEVDIAPALQQIKSGNIQNASKILLELKSKSVNDPSVIYLDAVLTKDGDEALRKYSVILEKYPDSKYADASLYRIFSYYYSLGYYKKAESYLDRLKKDFPESSYIKTADRKIPDIEEPSTIPENAPQLVVQQKKVDTKEYNFTIQAGAFLNVENAQKLSDQLKKENYFTEITSKEVGGSILNVVNVGRFANEEETKPVLNFLESKFNLKGRVVPINH